MLLLPNDTSTLPVVLFALFDYFPLLLLSFSCKVLEYFEVINTARADSSRPAMYQSSSSRMQRELFSPLSVWAQSFSIKGTG